MSGTLVEFALRPSSRAFVAKYVLVHSVLMPLLLVLGAWAAHGSKFELQDPLTVLVLWTSCAVFALTVFWLAAMLTIRPPAASLVLAPDFIQLPTYWLRPKFRQIPLVDVRSAVIVQGLFGRRLLLETGTPFGAQCPAWWFETPEAIEQIHFVVEAALLDRASTKDDEQYVKRQSMLGRRASITKLPSLLGVAWLVGFFAIASWFGTTYDTLYLTSLGANATWLTRAGEWSRLVSAATLHLGLPHLLVNAFAMALLLPQFVAMSGWAGSTVIFSAGAILGAAVSAWSQSAVAVGASSGIYGLLGAWLFWGIAVRGKIAMPFVGSPSMIGLLFVGEVLAKLAFPRLDTAAHLGGIVGGALAAWCITGRRISVIESGRSGPVIRAAAVVCIAGFVLIPAWSFARGISADSNSVASHAVAALAERDLPSGVSVRFGLELCLSPTASLAQVRGANERLASVSVQGRLANLGRVMVGCLQFRSGFVEQGWRTARDAAWREGDPLGGLVLGSIAHDAADARVLPFSPTPEPRVSILISRNHGGVEIRKTGVEAKSIGIDFVVEAADSTIVIAAWLPEAVQELALGIDELCGLDASGEGVIQVIEVFDWKSATHGSTAGSRCWRIAANDRIAQVIEHTGR